MKDPSHSQTGLSGPFFDSLGPTPSLLDTPPTWALAYTSFGIGNESWQAWAKTDANGCRHCIGSLGKL
jgi:hypothetical protein